MVNGKKTRITAITATDLNAAFGRVYHNIHVSSYKHSQDLSSHVPYIGGVLCYGDLVVEERPGYLVTRP